MAIDFPNSPSPGDNFTVNGKTWTFTDGKWALNVSVGGVQGPAGVAIQETAPATTDILWADTSDTGLVIVPAGGTTGQVLAKSSGADYATAWATPVTSGDMALKANLESPTFTGTPTLPTGTIATTQTAGNSTTAIATTAFVGTAVANLVDSAPATLNTLDELALALGDDANFATTTATAIGLKAPLASPALTGTPTAPTAAVGTNTTQIATTEFVQVANPTGAVIAFAGSSAPTGWLLCGGQEVAISSNGALYAVIGTTYGSLTNGSGGAGTTHFRVPDLRGRTVAGIDNMGGVDAGRLDIANSSGTVVGTQYVTLTSAEMPSHTHTQNSHNHTQDSHNHSQNAHTHAEVYNGAPTGGGLNGSVIAYGTTNDLQMRGVTISSTTATNIATTATNQANTATNQNTGGGGAHNNMQPTMVLNYIIKA
jgi:microcystin-dependent protein